MDPKITKINNNAYEFLYSGYSLTYADEDETVCVIGYIERSINNRYLTWIEVPQDKYIGDKYPIDENDVFDMTKSKKIALMTLACRVQCYVSGRKHNKSKGSFKRGK